MAGLLCDGLTNQAAVAPHLPAVLTPTSTLTYGELLKLAHQVAVEILLPVVKRLEPIGTAFEKSSWMVVAVYASWYAGAAYVPVDYAVPEARMATIAHDAGITRFMTSKKLSQDRAWPDTLHIHAIDVAKLTSTKPPPPPTQTKFDLAYVIYTSGSTGKPKGVAINHLGALNTCLACNVEWGVGPKDRVFGISSYAFDLSVYDLCGPMAAGAAVVMPDQSETIDPVRWVARIKEFNVTIWNSAPALLQLLLDTIGNDVKLPNLRLAALSGDWIPLTMNTRLKELAPNSFLQSLGGATEASIWSIWYHVTEMLPEWRSVPYGFAMPNQFWKILDGFETMKPVDEPGVTGEL